MHVGILRRQLRPGLIGVLLRRDPAFVQHLQSFGGHARELAVRLALLEVRLRLFDRGLGLLDSRFGLLDLLVHFRRIDLRQHLTGPARGRRCPRDGAQGSHRCAPESAPP